MELMTYFDKFRSWLHPLVQMSIILKDISVPGPNSNHWGLLAVSMHAVEAHPVSRLVFITLKCNTLGKGTCPET